MAGKKVKKDGPKRALSAFFIFSNEKRSAIAKSHPEWKVSDVAKELGQQWGRCADKKKYEALASKDKERYAKEKAAFGKKK